MGDHAQRPPASTPKRRQRLPARAREWTTTRSKRANRRCQRRRRLRGAPRQQVVRGEDERRSGAEQRDGRAPARRATGGGRRPRAGASSRACRAGARAPSPRGGAACGPIRPTAGRSTRRARTRPAAGRAPKRNGDVTSSTSRPRASERRGELVVVRRREGGGIGEDDVHRRSADDGTRSLGSGAMELLDPHLEPLPRQRRPAAAGGLPPADDRARDRRRARRRLPAGGAGLGAAGARRLVGHASVRRRHAAAALAGAGLDSGSRARTRASSARRSRARRTRSSSRPRHAATDLGHERISRATGASGGSSTRSGSPEPPV